MRNSVIALAVVACVTLPQFGSAKEAISLRTDPTEGATRFRDQLSELLHQFGIGHQKGWGSRVRRGGRNL
jgi:hypothetical protein